MKLRWSELDIVSYTDPASGKRTEELKRTKARQAICVLGQDKFQRLFVLHAHAARETTEDYMDRLLQVNTDFRPRVFGLEANGMQTVFGDAVALRAKERGVRFPLVPVWQPTNVRKEWRIRSVLQPLLHRLFLQAHQDELRKELTEHPNGITVDLVDALATAVTLLPNRPAANAAEDEVAALAAHLRDAGLSPSHIAKRVEEVRRELGLC